MSVRHKFHLKEIDWVLYFPATGNEGRSLGRYGIAFRDRLNGAGQPGRRINLEVVLSMPRLADHYPHMVGHFQRAVGRGRGWAPAYIESSVVRSREELERLLQRIVDEAPAVKVATSRAPAMKNP